MPVQVQAALQAGGNPNDDTPVDNSCCFCFRKPAHHHMLTVAAGQGNLEIVQALLAGGAKDCSGARGLTALLNACKNGHAAVVDAILSAGAGSPDGEPGEVPTPLAVAAMTGHVRVLEALLRAGAAVDRVNEEFPDWTPLMYACSYSHADCVGVLIKGGAQVRHRRDSNGTVVTQLLSCAHFCRVLRLQHFTEFQSRHI